MCPCLVCLPHVFAHVSCLMCLPLALFTGGPQKRHGAVGKTVLVDVPLGTIVYDTTLAEDRTSYTNLTRATGRSSATANAAAAVRLAEAEPSGEPPWPDHSRQLVEPSYREALDSESLVTDDDLGSNADSADHGVRRPTASEGLSFDSPDLSFSPWSVIASRDSTAGLGSFGSPGNHSSSTSHSAVGDAHNRDSNGNTLQPVGCLGDIDGLAFATPDISFSACAVVGDGTSETDNDDTSARDPWDSRDSAETDSDAGIVFDSPDLSFSPWAYVPTLPAGTQQLLPPGNGQEASSNMTSTRTQSYGEDPSGKSSSEATSGSGAFFPVAAAGRAGSSSSVKQTRHSTTNSESDTSSSSAKQARRGTAYTESDTSSSSVEQTRRRTADTDSATSSSEPEAPQEGSLGTRAQLDSLPVMADLVEEGQKVVVARGGRGGRGNATYRTRPNTPASKRHESGEAGTFHPDQ